MFNIKKVSSFIYLFLISVKLILEWIREHPRILCDRSFIQRPALWPILAILLNKLQSFIQKAENKPDICKIFFIYQLLCVLLLVLLFFLN